MNWTLKIYGETGKESIEIKKFESFDEAIKSINLVQLNVMNVPLNVVILNRVGVCHFRMSVN